MNTIERIAKIDAAIHHDGVKWQLSSWEKYATTENLDKIEKYVLEDE